MSMILLLFLFVLISSNLLASSLINPKYDLSFVERYSMEGRCAILVCPCNDGYCLIDNEIMKQLVYTQYPEYENYVTFLSDVLNKRIMLTRKGSSIIRYDNCPPVLKPIIAYLYLKKSDTNPNVLLFRNDLTEHAKVGIMKMMFDLGYDLIEDDYSGEVYIARNAISYPPL